jgi:putative transposase
VQTHSDVRLLVHVVWATMRREPVIAVEADGWFERLLARKAAERGCELLACGCAADHVHALVRYASTVTVASLVQVFKGYSSYAWNCAAPRRLSWQAGYWAESVSPGAARDVAAYVTAQRQHHQRFVAAEPWELSPA